MDVAALQPEGLAVAEGGGRSYSERSAGYSDTVSTGQCRLGTVTAVRKLRIRHIVLESTEDNCAQATDLRLRQHSL